MQCPSTSYIHPVAAASIPNSNPEITSIQTAGGNHLSIDQRDPRSPAVRLLRRRVELKMRKALSSKGGRQAAEESFYSWVVEVQRWTYTAMELRWDLGLLRGDPTLKWRG